MLVQFALPGGMLPFPLHLSLTSSLHSSPPVLSQSPATLCFCPESRPHQAQVQVDLGLTPSAPVLLSHALSVFLCPTSLEVSLTNRSLLRPSSAKPAQNRTVSCLQKPGFPPPLRPFQDLRRRRTSPTVASSHRVCRLSSQQQLTDALMWAW